MKGVRHLLFVTEDITERKNVQEALRFKTDTLNAIFESAPYAMVLMDAEGRVMDINQTGLAFAGKEKDGIICLLCGDVFSCGNATGEIECGKNLECANCTVRDLLARTFQTGISIYHYPGQMSILKNGGEELFYYLISTALLKTNEGDRVLVTLADITELRRTGDALRVR